MRRFKSILFVVDGSEGEGSALARAAGLANGAKLTLFAALDAELYQFSDPETLAAIEAMNELHVEQCREELESLRGDAISATSGVDRRCRSGEGHHGYIGDSGGTRQQA